MDVVVVSVVVIIAVGDVVVFAWIPLLTPVALDSHFHREALQFTGKRLGAGASARVHLAKYYGKLVAVKQLQASDKNRRLFENELALLQ